MSKNCLGKKQARLDAEMNWAFGDLLFCSRRALSSKTSGFFELRIVSWWLAGWQVNTTRLNIFHIR